MAIPLTDKVIATARAEIGYHEGKSGGHWNNKQKYSSAVPGLEWSDWQAWCATFVSWVAMTAGAAKLFPRTASCAAGVKWFKDRKRFSEYPAIGAQVFFGPGGGTHTGLVVDYDADTITTVEGNTNTNGSAEGDGVYRKTRQRRDAYVYGYGYPDYPEGIRSADPEWADERPEPTEPAAPDKPPAPATKPKAPAFPGREKFKLGAKNKYAEQLQTWLHKGNWGPKYTVGPSETMTQKDLAKVAALQRHYLSALGPADGGVGPKTWQYAFEVANGLRKK